MPQGIGIRYSENGSRALGLEKNDNGYRVTGIAAGTAGSSPESFLSANGFDTGDSVIACGLCPGEFLTAFVPREEGMDNLDMNEQLSWEINRKLLSPQEDYSIDLVISDKGFAFAGRRDIIANLKGSINRFVTDVEPVALYNGCETAGEVGNESLILLAIEGEGISTVLVSGGMLVGIESYPVHQDTLMDILPGLSMDAFDSIDPDVVKSAADETIQSISRLIAIADKDGVAKPERIVLSGAGAYLPGLGDRIESSTGLPITLSNPAAVLPDEIIETHPELSNMSAAFAATFGLAVRAIEEY